MESIEMSDLEKEREAFEYWAAYNGMGTYIYASLRKYSSNETEAAWSVWKIKQAEIDSLKARLEKVESGEYVIVPKSPTLKMLKVADKHVMDCNATPESAYKAMIEAAQEQNND